MAVSWTKDIDAALNQARTQHKPVLVDFSAAPA
jgi:Thioredoxin-like